MVDAIRSTFKRRQKEIPPNTPVALSDDFVTDKSKQQQWSAFIKLHNVHQIPESLAEIVSSLSQFLLPSLNAATSESETWHYSWKNGGPWIKLNIKD